MVAAPERNAAVNSGVAKTGASAARLSESVVVLWRGPQTVQLELGGRRVVIDGIDQTRFTLLLDRRPTNRDDKKPSDSGPPWLGPLMKQLELGRFRSRKARGAVKSLNTS